MTTIPEWIIKYDQANYQSGAGKAVRFLLKELDEAQKLHKRYFDKFNETFEIATERTNELNKANEKISHLEELLKAADEVIKELKIVAEYYGGELGESSEDVLEKYQTLKNKQ